jgi:hypothetical protein
MKTLAAPAAIALVVAAAPGGSATRRQTLPGN